MRNFLLLPLVVAIAIVLALWARMPPSEDGGTGYSLAQAQQTLNAIAREPRPAGSPGNQKARDWLAGRFTGLGLAVERQAGIGVRQANFDARRKGAVSVSPYENIIAVLPGTDRKQKAVALMAHVDSAPWANGASDDAAGVAALVETARVLAAGPKPKRDVVFLVTDAEELGLIGAQEFFSSEDFAGKIGAVVNVEARGSRGRAFMFQTSPGNSALVDLWARHAVSPSGNSLAGDVYRRLPNDTDLSVPLAKGVTGINAAFIDGLYDYHMPTDNIENLDPKAMQHLGNFALTTTRALAMADAIPPRAGEASYFDFFGLFVIRYPAWGGWVLLVAGFVMLCWSGFWRLGIGWRQALGGAAGMLALTAGVGAVAHFAANWAYGSGIIAMRERINEMDLAMWIFVALASGAVLLVRPRAAMWAGSVIVLLLFALAAQIWMPGAAWLFDGTALIGAGLLALAVRKGIASSAALYSSAIVGGIWGALLLAGVIVTYMSVAPMTPAPVALIMPFVVVLIAPVIMAFGDTGWSRRIGAGLIALAVAGALWFAWSDSFSARHPRPGDLFHFTDLRSGKSYWATTSTARELPAGKVSGFDMRRFNAQKWRAVPGPAHAMARPSILLKQQAGQITVRLASAAVPRAMAFMITPSVEPVDATVNGRPVRLPEKTATRIAWRAETPGAELVLQFKAAQGGKLSVEYLYALEGLPPGAPKPKGPATDWTALNGTSAVSGETVLSFAGSGE